MQNAHPDRPRPSGALSRLRQRCRPVLFCFLALLAPGGIAHAASYYEANAPYRFGTGGARFGSSVDAATGAFLLRGQLASIPGRVPISLKWGFNSQDNSNGPLGTGTSLSTDFFIAASTVLGAGYYEIQAPGNRRYAFRDALNNGNYVNSTDPEVLGAVLTFASPPNGLTSTLRWKDGRKFFFDAGGALYQVQDRLGNTLSITRNGSGYPTQISQPSGRSVTLSYGANGNLSSLTLPLSRSWQFSYDPGTGRLTRVTDTTGAHWDYTWSTYTRSDGVTLPLVVTVADRLGNVQITNGYDSSGRVSTQTYNDNGVLHVSYSAGIGTSGYSSVTDPKGNVTRQDFSWNSSLFGYNVTSTTNALGRVTTIGRSGTSFLVTSVTDFRNRTISLGWDQNKGNLTSVTKPTASGGTVTWSYSYESTFSQPTQATDPLGHASVYTVDATTGNITAVRDPRQFVTTYSYASNGDLLSVTNVLNQVTSATYSSDGDLLTLTDPASHTTTFGYDGASRRTSVQDANLKTTQTAYDAMDRVTSVTQYLSGNPIVTGVQYDAEGRRRFLTDANNHVWEWRFDSKGRLFQEVNPLLASTLTTFDLNDNPLVEQDRKGQQSVYSYGTGDRLTQATFKRADGATESNYTVNYNATTDLVDSVVDSVAGTFSWSYDSLDRTLSETCPGGNCIYTWDDLGRRTSVSPAGVGGTSYTYDERNQISAESQDGYTFGFNWDGLGRLTDQYVVGYQGGIHRDYNPDGTLADLGTNRAYLYDAVGNMTDQWIGQIHWHYTYDDLYRMVGASYVNATYTWIYDSVGNRLWQHVVHPRTGDLWDAYQYDAANRLVSFNGNPLTYDANGSLLTYGNDSYTWDVRNRLTALNRTGDTPLTASFGYDWRDGRVSKTINGTTTTMLNDAGSVVCEGSGGVMTGVTQGPFVDQPLMRGGVFFQQDHLGSTVALTDANGNISQSYSYQPFGDMLTQPVNQNPYQYTGRENDGTGLMYYRARYYAPQWGRFVSEDPVGLEGGINQYAYANNAPLNNTDPSGLEPVPGEKLPVGDPNGIVYAPDKRGDAPRDANGDRIDLHHQGQKPDGPIDEMRIGPHRGKGNHGKNHSMKKGSGVPRGSAWDAWRRAYWQREWDSGRFNGLPRWQQYIRLPEALPSLDWRSLARVAPPVYTPPWQQHQSVLIFPTPDLGPVPLPQVTWPQVTWPMMEPVFAPL